jgi:hypothetical protein
MIRPDEIRDFYDDFDAPITALDCGRKCAPYNPSGKPFCCDICHAVPTAYAGEWEYLQANTDLWHEWRADKCVDNEAERLEELARLQDETADNMILMECLGPDCCQREYRALTCRQFPFFPYLTSGYEFIGLSYYWEFEDQCWVISNLSVVSDEYRRQFIAAFDRLFDRMPEELDAYAGHSEHMREEFAKRRRTIPLLGRDGGAYKISPASERLRRIPVESLPKYGPYRAAAALPFPDELTQTAQP